jgi:NADH-ubiquinone oxidoreductase chain 5
LDPDPDKVQIFGLHLKLNEINTVIDKEMVHVIYIKQLGMMVIAVGLSQFNVALMHLVLHAMYKAGLFLAAGSVLHAMGDQQDFRRFGGLVKILPLTYIVILIASLSLAALP